MAPSPARHRPLTPDELTLWRQAMQDTVPLRPASTADLPLPAARPVVMAPVPAPRPALSPPATPAKPGKPPPPPLKVGATLGIDRNTDDRLRRGKLAIEARIDLHGMTQQDAHAALGHFLHAGHRAGRRCVLIITGKGTVGHGKGVLRNAVPRWLAEPELRHLIVTLHHAQPRDGGEGALYVLLKRQRPPTP